MNEFIMMIINIAPKTSLFRSGASFVFILLTIPLVYFEVLVFLSLALKSIGVVVPIKRILLPGFFQAILVFAIRQLIPVPFHILITFCILIISVLFIGKLSISKAIIATSFTESAIILGTIIVSEPFLFFIPKELLNTLLSTPIGFCLGTIIEVLLPLAILIVFSKYNLSLLTQNSKKGDLDKGK